MPHIEMDPLHGTIIKSIEIICFFPLHSIIHFQHIYSTGIYKSIQKMRYTTGFYRGIHFNLMYLPINRFIDLKIYKHYDSSIPGSLLSSSLKLITYPLHTCEVYYLLNNKLPKLNILYNGGSFYFISNTLSYLIWFNSLTFYNKIIPIKNYNLKNAIVGLFAGLSIDFIMNPLKVIKTNYQNNTNEKVFLNNFKKIKLFDRGLKIKLILSALQSSTFNTFILWK